MNDREYDSYAMELTDDYKYAVEVVLLLEIDDNSHYYYKILDNYDIKGKRLERFYKLCCNENFQYLKESLCFLNVGYIKKEDVLANIDNKKPIPFITRLLKSPREIMVGDLYGQYKRSFYEKFNRKGGR